MSKVFENQVFGDQFGGYGQDFGQGLQSTGTHNYVLIWNAWGMLIWYRGVAMGLLFPHIPKKEMSRVWRHNDVIIADFAQFGDFQWNKGRNWFFFLPTSSKY